MSADLVQFWLTLCDHMDCSPPGLFVGVLQERILEWIATPSSRGTVPIQGSNPNLLYLPHWQAYSLSLVPPGKTHLMYQFSSAAQSCLTLCDSMATARQASLPITNSRSLLKLVSIESVMPSNHPILCHPLLLLPSIFPSIRVFSDESTLHMRWPKYWSFSFNISLSQFPLFIHLFAMKWWDQMLCIFYHKKIREKGDNQGSQHELMEFWPETKKFAILVWLCNRSGIKARFSGRLFI